MTVDFEKVANWDEFKDMVVALENNHILTLNRLKAYQDKLTPVPPKQVTEIEYQCAACGSTVIVGDNYCHVCGQKLREDDK